MTTTPRQPNDSTTHFQQACGNVGLFCIELASYLSGKIRVMTRKSGFLLSVNAVLCFSVSWFTCVNQESYFLFLSSHLVFVAS